MHFVALVTVWRNYLWALAMLLLRKGQESSWVISWPCTAKGSIVSMVSATVYTHDAYMYLCTHVATYLSTVPMLQL